MISQSEVLTTVRKYCHAPELGGVEAELFLGIQYLGLMYQQYLVGLVNPTKEEADELYEDYLQVYKYIYSALTMYEPFD